MDIGTKVIDIIAEQAILDPGDVTLESTLDSLGIDSMGLVESIFEIEEAFALVSSSQDANPTYLWQPQHPNLWKRVLPSMNVVE